MIDRWLDVSFVVADLVDQSHLPRCKVRQTELKDNGKKVVSRLLAPGFQTFPPVEQCNAHLIEQFIPVHLIHGLQCDLKWREKVGRMEVKDLDFGHLELLQGSVQMSDQRLGCVIARLQRVHFGGDLEAAQRFSYNLPEHSLRVAFAVNPSSVELEHSKGFKTVEERFDILGILNSKV